MHIGDIFGQPLPTAVNAGAPCPMLRMYQLSAAELDQLAMGSAGRPSVYLLRRAELSKHILLLAGVAAVARRDHARDYRRARFAAGFGLLARVQARSANAAADVLALPQVGAWGWHCLNRMQGREDASDSGADRVPLWIDLGYLNTMALSAATRIGLPFDLVVPLRHGRLVLPGGGVADLAGVHPALAKPWAQAQIRSVPGAPLSGAQQARPAAEIVTAGGPVTSLAWGWSPPRRVRTEAGGLVLDVALDGCDPFLDIYGHPTAATSGHGAGESAFVPWSELLSRAWRLLAEHHTGDATQIAAGVRTIVPLRSDAPGRRVASTSCVAFGAVAIALPPDPVAFAESLVHEFQHVKLGAVADLEQMITAGPQTLSYAPWRNDPRPYGALLHGVYAFLGVCGFWRTQRHLGQPAAGLRGDIEFARWRDACGYAARILASSGRLTKAGHRFVSGIEAALCGWRDDVVSPRALLITHDLLAAHYLSWRVGHLGVSGAATERLAHAWEHGDAAPDGVAASVIVRDGWPDMRTLIRSKLLELRAHDPARFSHWQHGVLGTGTADLAVLDAADEALVNADEDAAASGYCERIAAGFDPGAWSGLALISWRHRGAAAAAEVGGDAPFGGTLRPELACALYERLRQAGGRVADPGVLLSWTAQRRPPGQRQDLQ